MCWEGITLLSYDNDVTKNTTQEYQIPIQANTKRQKLACGNSLN